MITTDTIIDVQGVGKRYQLGAERQSYETLRDKLASAFRGDMFRASPALKPFWALRDVSFRVQRGDVVGVVGRNGAGKSTLLKIISRITPPTEGRIQLTGRVGSLLEVGTGFHPELTGLENIFLSGAILGMTKAEIRSRLDEIVAFAEVEQFLTTPVKRYSSGMYARLAFSVAAHLESEILIVDEVLAVGDSAFQRKCLGRMSALGAAGRTVLFVSHNLPAVSRLCTRAVLLERGRIKRDGGTEEVLGDYMKNVANSSAVMEWEADQAPGARGVKLLSIRLLNDQNGPAASVSVDERLRLVLRYEVLHPIEFRCSATFSTQGVAAFTSIERTERAREVPGVYETSMSVPEHLLTEGEYSVTVSMFISRGAKERLAYAPEVISFLVTDPMTGESARGDFAGGIGGVVRPRLDWSTELMGSVSGPRDVMRFNSADEDARAD